MVCACESATSMLIEISMRIGHPLGQGQSLYKYER